MAWKFIPDNPAVIDGLTFETRIEEAINDLYLGLNGHLNVLRQDSFTTAAYTANTNYTVPQYIVGSKRLLVFLNGLLTANGQFYNEQGTTGQLSTTIRMTENLEIGTEIYCMSFQGSELAPTIPPVSTASSYTIINNSTTTWSGTTLTLPAKQFNNEQQTHVYLLQTSKTTATINLRTSFVVMGSSIILKSLTTDIVTVKIQGPAGEVRTVDSDATGSVLIAVQGTPVRLVCTSDTTKWITV
jgi:hypothetical protein